jgi:hypothetical protein
MVRNTVMWCGITRDTLKIKTDNKKGKKRFLVPLPYNRNIPGRAEPHYFIRC